MADPKDTAPQEGDHYVRTFASDAAALEKGQAPDFTKAEEAPRETREQILARLSAKALENDRAKAPPANTFEAARTAIPPRQAPATHASERLIESSSIIEEHIVAPSKTPLAPLPETLAPPPVPEAAPLHTYKSDAADEVVNTNASATSMLAAQGDHPVEVAALPVPARINRRLMIWSTAFIALGLALAIGGFVYWSVPKTVPAASPTSTRIFVDDEQEIGGAGDTLASAIVSAEAAPLAPGAVRLLYTAESTTTGDDIFTALNFAAPDILLRNIETAGSMAGIVDANGVNSPFFIISVDSYDDTAAGMRSWEPSMEADLLTLYPLYALPAASASSTAATSTASTTLNHAVPAENQPVGFVDEEITSHDVRALKDGLGDTLIVYGYFDQYTLIIARDELSYATILDRLATSNTQQ